MIKELDLVVLTQDIPEHGLRVDDIGTVVYVHKGGEGFEVEFVALDGNTVAVATLLRDAVRLVGPEDMMHARRLNVA